MTLPKFDWWGIVGLIIILLTWFMVSWSLILQDSIVNLLGQLTGALFLAIEAFKSSANRSVFIKVSMHILWILFVVIAIADYTPQF